MKKSLALAALLGFSGSAPAATVTYFNTVSVVEGVNTPLNLPKFNLSGQTLIGVTLGFNFSIPSFQLSVDNDTANPATGTYSFGTLGSVGFNISVPTLDSGFDSIDAGDFNITTQTANITLDPTTGDNTTTFNNTGLGDYAEFNIASMTVGDINHNVLSALIGSYVGGGNFNAFLNVDLIADFSPTSGGGGGGSIQVNNAIPTSTFEGYVTYTYVPEPSATCLLSLVGAGALLRRRRA